MAQTPTFLVTGGAGFIGSNLADELIRRGARVRILDNLVTGFRENLAEIRGDFDFVEGDLNDEKALDRAVDRAGGVVAGSGAELRLQRGSVR